MYENKFFEVRWYVLYFTVSAVVTYTDKLYLYYSLLKDWIDITLSYVAMSSKRVRSWGQCMSLKLLNSKCKITTILPNFESK